MSSAKDPPAVPRWFRWFGVYTRTIEGLAGVSMAIILAVMIAQVVARYLFSGSLIWAEELCRYLLLWQTFLLLGVAYQRGEFVMLDVLPYMLGPRARLILKCVTAVPILIFLVVIVDQGFDYASRFDRQKIPALDFIWSSLTGNNAGVSVTWVYVSVPVGAALLALHVTADLVVSVLRHRALDDRMPPVTDIEGQL
ncbi:TRAP transporter small permease [Pseudooceanicola pacificus]|uniref:TRAP transporter small permease n=1 Tax=Pseudooceanicola pacificus TaxID=2676438 RepID=UPI0013664197|nr:TRAP transporter small permease [Pseudooceanicola pacificus]